MSVDDIKAELGNVFLSHDELPGVKVFLTRVTPRLAGLFLERNVEGQRTATTTTIDKYASDMISGAWQFAGDPVRFDDKMYIIDGQHRLKAIMDSGDAQMLMVVTGLDSGVIVAIDSGRKRSLPDQVRMTFKGIKYHKAVASLMTRMWYWDNGNYGKKGLARVPNASNINATPSYSQLFAYKADVEAKYGISFETAASVGVRAAVVRKGIGDSSYGLLYMLMARVDPYRAEEFFHEFLVESRSTSPEYPIERLKNRLMNKDRKENWENWLQLHWLTQIANAWSADQTIGSLRTPPVPQWNTLATLKLAPKADLLVPADLGV